MKRLHLSRQQKRHGQSHIGPRRRSAGGVRVPFPDWLGDYRKEWLRPDIIAGLTVRRSSSRRPGLCDRRRLAGAVGLYTALVPMVIYALLGSSRVLQRQLPRQRWRFWSPRNSERRCPMRSGKLCHGFGDIDCLVGAILVDCEIHESRLVANFISAPVLIGFKAGVGIVIVVDQIPKLLGIHIQEGSL